MNLIYVAKHAASEAMKIADKFFKNPKVLSSKSKDIKTLVDIEMNKCIVENLKSTQFSIISEEIEKRPTKIPNQCWIIDPLDGTYNFTRKFPVVGISIAFFDNGKPVLGLVQDIFNKNIYHSEAGGGSKKNGFKIKVSNVSELKNAILSMGFPSGTSYESKELFDVVSLVQKFKKIRAIGCASLMLSYVAEGVFDVYYEKDIYLWDVAAGLSLVKEAGGRIYFKKTNNYKYEVLAANKNIFDKAKKLLIK